jgi:hypothetical protein
LKSLTAKAAKDSFQYPLEGYAKEINIRTTNKGREDNAK